jgi:metallophosphoesterase (TIGR00282 family)
VAVIKVLMIGDVVGDPGLAILEERLPGLVAEHNAVLTVVNGENAAGGFGLTEEGLDRILAAGADVVTSGNHIWEKREFWPVLDGDKPVLRPANYPAPGTVRSPAVIPGVGWISLEKEAGGETLSFLVINLQGRERMTPIDCPFCCFDLIMERWYGSASESHPFFDPAGEIVGGLPIVLVDFHAESTEEKEALGYYLDGRAGIVAGTHTHVQTADERLLPKGTAYITDLGMTGATNGVIGMDAAVCIQRAKTQIAYRLECARPESGNDCAVQGIVASIDSVSGKALSITRITGCRG